MGISTTSAAAPALDHEAAGSEAYVAREARVAELRNQYQNDTYKVDAAELSTRIVEFHL